MATFIADEKIFISTALQQPLGFDVSHIAGIKFRNTFEGSIKSVDCFAESIGDI